MSFGPLTGGAPEELREILARVERRLIAFRDAAAVDAQGVVITFERARSVISDMLGDLPPDDGGDRALALSQRPA